MSLAIWNKLDEVALYLGIERLDGETDEEFGLRIKKFSKWKYGTSYNTQAHSIPLQCGLETKPIFSISSEVPFECIVGWDYFTVRTLPVGSAPVEYARVFIQLEDNVISKIEEAVSKLSSVKFTIIDDSLRDIHNRFIIRISNMHVASDFVGGSSYKLSHSNLIRGGFSPNDRFNCRTEKSSLIDLKRSGDYFVDYETGFVATFNTIPEEGFMVSYKYYDPEIIIEATELALIPINELVKYGITDDMIDMIPYLLEGRVWGK